MLVATIGASGEMSASGKGLLKIGQATVEFKRSYTQS